MALVNITFWLMSRLSGREGSVLLYCRMYGEGVCDRIQERGNAEGLSIYYDNDALCWLDASVTKKFPDNAHCLSHLHCMEGMIVFVVDKKGTKEQSETTR